MAIKPSWPQVAAVLFVIWLPANAAQATSPPSCATEDIYPDISGVYDVTGSCGSDWCPIKVELDRWDNAYCAFEIIDGVGGCARIDNDENGTLFNAVTRIAAGCSGLSCRSTDDLGGGAMRLVGCSWNPDTGSPGSSPINCTDIVLQPGTGPLPGENHPCRGEVNVTAGEQSKNGKGCAFGSTNSVVGTAALVAFFLFAYSRRRTHTGLLALAGDM